MTYDSGAYQAESERRRVEVLQKKADAYDDEKRLWRWGVIVVVGFFLLLLAIVFTWKLVTPRLNLYKSNTEKQAVIKEQEAISDAAEYAARSRVTQAEAEASARLIEAQAIAESQALIAETLTPEYLQWRFYEVLATTSGQVIYVPMDGSLPITEAGRRQATVTSEP